jgi:predicted CopG family antitoxin
MRRTQILIEEWQYQILQNLASTEKKSLSSIIRELITEKLVKQKAASKDKIFEVVGMVEGKGGRVSEEIEKRLYQRRRK